MLVASSSACSGAVESSDHASSARLRQAETSASPLYTIHDPIQTFAAAVDDANDLYVLGFLPAPSDSRETPPLYGFRTFDPGGALLGSVAVDYHDRITLQMVRARGATVALGGYAGGPAFDRPRDVAPDQMLVYAYQATGSRLFMWTGPTDTTVTSIDVCGDGTIAAAGQGASGAVLVRLDPTGNALYQTALPGTHVAKVRCDAQGQVQVGGSTTDANANAVAASYAADGTPRWTWTGPDAASAATTFDVDDAGGIVLAGTRAAGGGSAFQIYALDPAGSLSWSWTSDGPADALASVYAGSGAVLATGARGPAGARHVLTVRLDASGAVLWTRDDPAGAADASGVGVSLDGAGDAFVCGYAGALNAILYGPDGTTQWAAATPAVTALGADVTSGVARCLGTGAWQSLSVLAFAVP